MDRFRRSPDAVVADIAGRQHGAVSLAQLREAGLTDGQVRSRVRRGQLHRVHRGVYAVGHARLSGPGRLWAATLATAAPLSHRTAAALWDLLPWPSGPIDVTTPRRGKPMAGIRVHESRTLTPDAVTRDPQLGLPVTTPSRTIIDLAAILTAHRLERVCHRARQLGLLDAGSLQPPPGRPSRNLRAALATLADAQPQITRSAAEEAFLQIIADLRLPPPHVNEPYGPYVPDFRWPELDLIIEIDGRGTHLTPTAFEEDRERDARLLIEHDQRTLRFTRHQVVYRRPYVAGVMSSTVAPRG
jgi:very-short-patch-repair endonuclease